jgi:hypothetical protein
MAGEAASLWTKVHQRINDALRALVGLYDVTEVDETGVTIDLDGSPRVVFAPRGADIRPGDQVLVIFIDRDGYAIHAFGG